MHYEACNNRNMYKRESRRGKVDLLWLSEKGRIAREDFAEKLEFNQSLEGYTECSRSRSLERRAWGILRNTWPQSNMEDQAMRKECCGMRRRRADGDNMGVEYQEGSYLQVTRKADAFKIQSNEHKESKVYKN